MWYSFEVITGLKETLPPERVYAELRHYMVFCESVDKLHIIIDEHVKDIQIVPNTINILDNFQIFESEELSIKPGLYLQPSVRSIREAVDFELPLNNNEEQIPFEITFFMLVFDMEENFQRFASGEGESEAHSVEVFQDPNRYFLPLVD